MNETQWSTIFRFETMSSFSLLLLFILIELTDICRGSLGRSKAGTERSTTSENGGKSARSCSIALTQDAAEELDKLRSASLKVKIQIQILSSRIKRIIFIRAKANSYSSLSSSIQLHRRSITIAGDSSPLVILEILDVRSIWHNTPPL
jgi:hypothetical protein